MQLRRAIRYPLIAVLLLALFAAAWVAHLEWQRRSTASDVGAFADFLEPIPADENAAPLYRAAYKESEQAYDVLANFADDPLVALGNSGACPCNDGVDGTDATPLDDEMIAAIHRYMAAAERGYEMLAEAAGYDRSRFGDYSDPMKTAMDSALIDDMRLARENARQMMYRAKWEIRNDRPDEAFLWVQRGLRLSNHLGDEGTNLMFLVRSAIAGIALAALNDALCAGVADVSPAGIVDELKTLQDRQQYAQVYATERIIEQALQEYARATANAFQRVEMISRARAGDEALQTAILAVTEPDAKVRRKLRAEIHPAPGFRELFYDAVDGFYNPMWAQIIGATESLTQSSVELVERLIAQAALAEVGIYLYQFYNVHGKYPATIQDLIPEFAPSLPEDPFSGGSFFYKPSERGYLLYSVGRDGEDDGGSVDWREGDIVWCIGR